MINGVLKLFTGKELVIFVKHRNSIPLLNAENKKHYIFLDPFYLWKFSFLFGRNSKLRYKAMAVMLSILSPRFIIDINWISKQHSLYLAWCRKHSYCKFVVVQHGAYVAGLITDIPHRYAKCQVMLCWSNYFIDVLKNYNTGKQVKFLLFGNPPYNQYNRNEFNFPTTNGNKILVAPSLIKETRLTILLDFLQHLKNIGFDVYVKEHFFQPRYAQSIEGFNKVTGDFYSILKNHQYDIVITDVSSCMLDILCFKNKALYFSPAGEADYNSNNEYSKYLENLANCYKTISTKDALLQYINIEKQEALFQHLVYEGNNQLKPTLSGI
ncbi:MAG: hypothetical protein ACOYKE_04185 [Ferruginibacter sp.]